MLVFIPMNKVKLWKCRERSDSFQESEIRKDLMEEVGLGLDFDKGGVRDMESWWVRLGRSSQVVSIQVNSGFAHSPTHSLPGF